jgi:hypothetical protein
MRFQKPKGCKKGCFGRSDEIGYFFADPIGIPDDFGFHDGIKDFS